MRTATAPPPRTLADDPPAGTPTYENLPTRLAVVPIAAIDRSGNLRKRYAPRSIEELAASIESEGLQTPPLVALQPAVKKGGDPSYVLIAGERRIRAHEHLKRTEIAVLVRPPADRATLLKGQAIENLQREDLTPSEQVAVIVAFMGELEGHHHTDGDRFKEAALQLGKDEQWVRDHCYLARLEAKVAAWLDAGEITAGQARELAKLAGPDQVDVANIVRVQGNRGERVYTIAEVRQRVESRRRSLRVVPWDLSLPFAGKPACADCPHNTASDPVLFGTGSSTEAAGTCTNGLCFEAKSRAAEKARDAAVAKLRKKGDTSASAVEAAAPTWLKPSSVRRAAKKAIEGEKPAKAKEGKATHAEPKLSEKQRRQAACREYDGELGQWGHRLLGAICKAATPAQRAALLLLQSHRLYETEAAGYEATPTYPDNKVRTSPAPEKACSSGLLRLVDAVRRADAEALAELARGYASTDIGDSIVFALRLNNAQPDLLLRLAGAFEVDVEGKTLHRPLFEDFLPAPTKPKSGKRGPGIEDPKAKAHEIKIKTPPGVTISIRVTDQCADGFWRSSFHYQLQGQSMGSLPNVRDEPHARRDTAIAAALLDLRERFRKSDDPKAKKALAAVDAYSATGICDVCRCTEDTPCQEGCAWANAERTLCTSCVGKSGPKQKKKKKPAKARA